MCIYVHPLFIDILAHSLHTHTLCEYIYTFCVHTYTQEEIGERYTSDQVDSMFHAVCAPGAGVYDIFSIYIHSLHLYIRTLFIHIGRFYVSCILVDSVFHLY